MLAKLKKRKRLRVHGFLSRSNTPGGRKVLRDRRRKGRHELTVSYPKRFQNVRGKAKLHIIAGGTAKPANFDGKGNYIVRSK